MKKTILIICTLFLVGINIFSQNVSIPDPNFKNYLLNNSSINLNGDGQISLIEAETFTGKIDVTERSISDLTGIGAFINLSELRCKQNNLQVLDISKNTKLKKLYCEYNPLGALDVTNNPLLERLSATSNGLGALDLSQNPNLLMLNCHDNQLTTLDVSLNTVLEELRCTSNLLDCVQVNANQLVQNWDILAKDSQTILSIDCSDKVIIPDTNFKNALLNHDPVIDINNDGEISFYEAHSFNEMIDVSNTSWDYEYYYENTPMIQNLTGIEAFTNLKELRCAYNKITTLDISENLALINLDCSFNELTTLDVSKNNSLINLNVSNGSPRYYNHPGSNKLSSIDLSNNLALQEFKSDYNQLTSIDVSKNSALTSFRCEGNQLTSIDVSNNTSLTFFSCGGNQLTSIDVSNNNALEALIFSSNQLTNIDVSNNTALTDLYCDNNQLTSLDVSSNFDLEQLNCEKNVINNLDLSQQTKLWYLKCRFNNLKSLDVSNGNNTGFGVFLWDFNEDLECINVDNANWSFENWTDNDYQFSDKTDDTEQYSSQKAFYYRIGVLTYDEKNWPSITDVEHIEGNIYKVYYCGPFSNNEFYFNVNNDNSITYPVNKPNGEPQLLNGQPLITCESNPSDMVDVDCNNSNYVERGNDNRIEKLVMSFGYYTSNAAENTGARQFYQELIMDTTNPVYSEDCSALSSEDLTNNIFTVYPNPASNYITLESTLDGNYNIVSILGKTVLRGVVNEGGNTIDISILDKGIYFLNVKSNRGSETIKIIKK